MNNIDVVPPGLTIKVPGWGDITGLNRIEYPSLAEFRGIPYAEPPIGPLRWQPPQMHRGWEEDNDGTRYKKYNATSFGNVCMQPRWSASRSIDYSDRMSEDCLFLNIVTPKAALDGNGKELLPVIMWIHGGDLLFGAGDSPDMAGDMAALVSSSGENILGITINYRLNVFGFLGGDEAMSHTDGAGAGNFGIQDQSMAMSWINEHIIAFGGDGDDITIFGSNAGGQSIINHLTQPASFDLYQKAIIQSGAYGLCMPQGPLCQQDFNAISMEDANEYFEKFLSESSCTDISCLVYVDAKPILEAGMVAYHKLGWTTANPVVDGVSMTDTPAVLIDAKQYNNKVPIIIGSNRDEYDYFAQMAGLPQDLTETQFDALYPYSTMEPEMLADLKHIYNQKSYSYPANLGGHSIWYWTYVRHISNAIPGLGHCGSRWLARKLFDGGTPAVYNYLFGHAPNIISDVFVPHTSKIPYVFDMICNNATIGSRNLGKQISSYWSNFARNGDPNPIEEGSLIQTDWPMMLMENKEYTIMLYGGMGRTRVEGNVHKSECDWQTEQTLANGGFPGYNPHQASSFQWELSSQPTPDNETDHISSEVFVMG